MPKGELPPSSPDEILTVVIMKVAIMLKMTMAMTMVMVMIGNRALPVRVGKSDVTFHGDTHCHVQRTHLKMFLGRITVMRFF